MRFPIKASMKPANKRRDIMELVARCNMFAIFSIIMWILPVFVGLYYLAKQGGNS